MKIFTVLDGTIYFLDIIWNILAVGLLGEIMEQRSRGVVTLVCLLGVAGISGYFFDAGKNFCVR